MYSWVVMAVHSADYQSRLLESIEEYLSQLERREVLEGQLESIYGLGLSERFSFLSHLERQGFLDVSEIDINDALKELYRETA